MLHTLETSAARLAIHALVLSILAIAIDLRLTDSAEAGSASSPSTSTISRTVSDGDRDALPRLLSGSAAEAPRVEELTRRRRAALEEVDSARRLAALEQLWLRRAALLTDSPDDPRRGSWMIDEAEELLVGVLPARGLDFISLFGWPSASEREETARIARQAIDRIDGATVAIGAVVRRIDEEAALADDGAVERWRDRLVDRELAVRIPALQGIAWGMLANVTVDRGERGESTAASHRRVVESLWPILIELDGTPRTLARMHLVLSLASLGRVADAESILRSIRAEIDPSPLEHLRASLIEIEVARRVDGPRAALAQMDRLRPPPRALAGDLFVRLLLTDLRGRLLWENGDRHVGLYIDLLDSLSVDARRGLLDTLLDRLADRFPADVDAPQSSLVEIARARHAVRSDRDAVAATDALARLDEIQRDAGLTGLERATAAITLARLFDVLERPVDAIRTRVTLARQLPGQAESVEAIVEACRGALRHWLSTRHDEDAALLRVALETFLDRFSTVETAERWRSEAAYLAAVEGRIDDLHAIAVATPRHSPWLGETKLLLASSRRTLQRRMDKIDHAAWRALSTDVEAARAAMAEATPASDRVAADAITIERSAAALIRAPLLDADVQLALGRATEALESIAEAMALLEQSTEDAATAPGNGPIDAVVDGAIGRLNRSLLRSLRAEAMQFRLTALRALDRADEALRELDDFATDSPDAARVAIASLLATERRRVESLRDELRHEDADEIARRYLLPLSQALDRLLDETAERLPELESLRWRVADALLEAGRHQDALDRLERLLANRPDALEYLLARGVALASLGGADRMAKAMTDLRRVSAARSTERDRAFWRAEATMLAILIQVDGARDQVRPRIAQLRLRDPALGGDRWRRIFEELEIAVRE